MKLQTLLLTPLLLASVQLSQAQPSTNDGHIRSQLQSLANNANRDYLQHDQTKLALTQYASYLNEMSAKAQSHITLIRELTPLLPRDHAIHSTLNPSLASETKKNTDPDDVLQAVRLNTPIGENPEALLKAYKWIWGQEDVNYPTGQGRDMSWEGIKILLQKLIAQQE